MFKDSVIGHFYGVDRLSTINKNKKPALVGSYYVKGKEYSIYIYSNECSVPHMHIKSKNRKDICIGINEAKYISDLDHKGLKFTKEEADAFAEYMSYDNWYKAVMLWNDLNSDDIVVAYKKPEYKKLEGKKHYGRI